ncbi:CDP-glucose 4,6-dehydratase [Treponema socranskii]|uniref:CDP-glucose 4,6-dehydratase n=1 Tax=Treponema socranskii TaxID=53419 RepID=UPI003D6E9498
MKKILEKYKKKNVFITGHTGFKGAWLTSVLLKADAIVTGYSLEPPTNPSLFDLAQIKKENNLSHIIGDVRDFKSLYSSINKCNPDFVFHLAAQPIVRESYKDPRETYETNVMGTVNLLESVRLFANKNQNKHISVLNVTTDKVYENKEWCWGYRENEPLNGYDPYSNSKSCSELVTHSYKSSFFVDKNVRLSTARAGNVIGGGDFASDRIIPDCIRAIKRAMDENQSMGILALRNPYSIRPYQHVLDPIFAYLMIAAYQYEESRYSGYYNVGPNESSCITTGDLVEKFITKWDILHINESQLPGLKVEKHLDTGAPHESCFLRLDCNKLKTVFGWEPKWEIDQALEETAEFAKKMLNGEDMRVEMNFEIEKFLG